MKKSLKLRVDDLLVTQGLAESKTKAQAMIMAGSVRTESARIEKPGKLMNTSTILIVETPPQFVSRGGEKLEAFLNAFSIEVEGHTILDIGASTGGFTDCVLQRGAAHVTCVDVGRNQLHNKLCQHPKVISLPETNARYLKASMLPHTLYDGLVMDVSFISVTKLIVPMWTFLKQGGYLIVLIKPQFEATRAEVSKGKGVINDPDIHQRILDYIQRYVTEHILDASLIGCIVSPLLGSKGGNQEFLLGLRRNILCQ